MVYKRIFPFFVKRIGRQLTNRFGLIVKGVKIVLWEWPAAMGDPGPSFKVQVIKLFTAVTPNIGRTTERSGASVLEWTIGISHGMAPRQRSDPLMRTQGTAFQKTHIEWLVNECACKRDSFWSSTNTTNVGLDDRIFRVPNYIP